jgi:hypothetical protein
MAVSRNLAVIVTASLAIFPETRGVELESMDEALARKTGVST